LIYQFQISCGAAHAILLSGEGKKKKKKSENSGLTQNNNNKQAPENYSHGAAIHTGN
jgi:hypothetical protein